MSARRSEDHALLWSAQGHEVIGLAALAEVCWQGTSRARRSAHERHGRFRCPTPAAPYSERDPAGARVHPGCVSDECVDIFHDVLVEVRRRLARRSANSGRAPDDPIPYAASIIPSVLTDRARSHRVSIGLAAKPGRADGVAARVIGELHKHARTPVAAGWYEALFRILRDYSHIEGRTMAVWPVAWLAREKARHDGRPRDPESRAYVVEIRRDIALVIDVATRSAGAEWVQRMIWQPLSTLVQPTELTADLPVVSDAIEDQALLGWFRHEYIVRRERGTAAVLAYRQAAHVVSGRVPGLPPPDVMALLEDLDDAFLSQGRPRTRAG